MKARYVEAEPLYRRALAVDEASYGHDHPNIATGLNNLAELLRDINRLSEAEPLYRRALAIDEASYGPDHPNVAIRLNNLAGLLRATNRLSEAEPLYRRALAISEASYGPDHPNVAICLNNLAAISPVEVEACAVLRTRTTHRARIYLLRPPVAPLIARHTFSAVAGICT